MRAKGTITISGGKHLKKKHFNPETSKIQKHQNSEYIMKLCFKVETEEEEEEEEEEKLPTRQPLVLIMTPFLSILYF